MWANLFFYAFGVVLGRMFDGRGSGGPKPSLWKKRAAERFESFFGRYSGSVPLPARPTDAAQSSATEVAPQPPLSLCCGLRNLVIALPGEFSGAPPSPTHYQTLPVLASA